MATGDNILTAVSVAGQCGIIDASKPTFCGDLARDNRTGDPYILWRRQEANFVKQGPQHEVSDDEM
eukprot:CAMPEP_0185614500 /NCGR_PEP_ID=MMETSP0436-20130131/31897_1 /TAXON_ID=626734 ORGANISM="Favella taraikaensis, Strain Fe Narragansett Bay" /NCGR_SAMPLE_ID=MMETSP0436 /ASSEMBLY_ACC=CAM_ASM_000390 /LENGTH=65 /DNA_ID=CAMNT_0028249395 /DNA_START=919 /DNA_END=1116 /DNA_ORIENTATION=+